MSNLTGSVDVVREQERRARLQLLELREPSPQPIFGEPVKVELEDETSRRIKNTLGDFSQVLISDSKNLIGIPRTVPGASQGGSSRQALSSHRSHISSKRPQVLPNGLHKSSSSGLDRGQHSSYSKSSSEKRMSHPKHRLDSSSASKSSGNVYPPGSGPSHHPDKDRSSRYSDPAAGNREKDHRRTNTVPVTVNINISVSGGASVVSNSSISTSASSSVNDGCKSLNSVLQNGPNGLIRQQKQPSKMLHSKRGLPNLVIPEKAEKTVDSRIELETILREMKQAVPPPLTAIQTPKTEESGFAFPANVSEGSPYVKVDEQPISRDCGPLPSEKSKVLPNSLQSCQPPVSYNLQEDLEVSESDDEMVPEVKNPTAEYLKSPVNNAMNVPSVLSTRSSSSDSCESDSDESSSESNDSDSSLSSEASDVETPSKPAPQMWGLSNFLDETRRNHSPAFIPLDNNTNSSTAVKEEPTGRDSFSLVDEDSVNRLLGKYSDSDIHLPSSIPDILDLQGIPVKIKTEILSPISSPIHSSPPIENMIKGRGPRTPPSPPRTPSPSPIKEDDEIHHEVIERIEPRTEICQSYLQNSDKPLSKSRSDAKEEKNRLQNDKGKKQHRSDKNKNDTCISRIISSPSSTFYGEEDPSASRGLPDAASLVKGKDDNTTLPVRSSCSVPSESSVSTREISSSKSRHKHSVSSKKSKSYSTESTSESNHKKSNSTKSHSTKSKHSTAASKNSSDIKQKEKHVIGTSSSKVDHNSDFKRYSKSDRKEKKNMSGTEKSKESLKTSGHSKSHSKSSKTKSKLSKQSPKQISDTKKSEGKKKKKKFSIQNFLQSPTYKHADSERGSDGLPYFSPSPERPPIPETNSDTVESIRQQTISPSQTSRSPSRTSSKSAERTRSIEKPGNTPRRSERGSSAARSESSSSHREHSEKSYRSSRKTSKSRTHQIDDLPIRVELPPQLLSPIPQDSPIQNSVSDCAIPAKIMVSIPLDKLIRLPASVQAQDYNKQLPKARSLSSSTRSAEAAVSMPPKDSSSREKLSNRDDSSSRDKLSRRDDSASRDKISKHDDCMSRDKIIKNDEQSKDKISKRDASDKRQAKEFKEKTRTDSSSKHTKISSKNTSSNNKKEKSSKPSSDYDSKSKTSAVNNKSSVKSTVDKAHIAESENLIPKKRKPEEEQLMKKKTKTSSHLPEEKKSQELSAPSKKESLLNQTDCGSKSKPLERCDSTSSLSSLCSQQSQRSSKSSKEKSKESSKNLPESKKMKTLPSPVPLLKEIKQEKEEKPKVVLKKEPAAISVSEKIKKIRDKLTSKDIKEKIHDRIWHDGLNTSSQFCHWEEPCKEDPKSNATTYDNSGSDWDHFAPEMHKDLKETSNLNKHNSQAPIMPMDYFWTEGQKQKHLADKEKDPLLQVLKYFEATVLFILTSQQREEYTKDPDSVYQFYKETLRFSSVIRSSVQKLISQYHNTNPGSTEFKLLILCLKCQSLLHVKLYNLKIKEIKEQQKPVQDFFRSHCPNLTSSSRNPSHPSPHQPRLGGAGSAPSPHSPTPSPAGSVNSVGSQSSGYSSSDVGGNHIRSCLPLLSHAVNVNQSILDTICRQHTHLVNLHFGHDLWEQADMYMTRSNLREFFKEVADQSEPLTLHSTVKELVSYIQKGLSLVKQCIR